MITLHGKTVCGGLGCGAAFFLRRDGKNEKTEETAGASSESERLENALEAAKKELSDMAEKAEKEEAREIFSIHLMMLEDEDILTSLRDAVNVGGVSAEAAVADTCREFSEMLLATGDEYMMARADDVRDVLGRVAALLSGVRGQKLPDSPFVLVADELLPGELMRFSESGISGIVLGHGSLTSHLSVLIRGMGIPAVICGDISGAADGKKVLLDGGAGTAIFSPDKETEADFEEKLRFAAKSSETDKKSPFPCTRYANIGSAEEADAALFEKCDGVGLFRTEFLYMGRDDLPSEEEQVRVYTSVLRAAGGKPVTVRTFDLGADKQAKTVPIPPEPNPALGCRGARVYSLCPEVFMTQLRALLRSATAGNLRVMFPMVTSPRELAELKRKAEEAAKLLAGEGREYRMPELGVMIEVPAAVMAADELAASADFFSVGTNDLAQYTFAADREGDSADSYTRDNISALLRLVSMAAESAHRAGIKIGVCGELAADPALTEKWLAVGVDSLSVTFAG